MEYKKTSVWLSKSGQVSYHVDAFFPILIHNDTCPLIRRHTLFHYNTRDAMLSLNDIMLWTSHTHTHTHTHTYTYTYTNTYTYTYTYTYTHIHTHTHVHPSGNGSMVGAIMGSTKQEPNTVGKPSGFMLENIANTFKLDREEVSFGLSRLLFIFGL